MTSTNAEKIITIHDLWSRHDGWSREIFLYSDVFSCPRVQWHIKKVVIFWPGVKTYNTRSPVTWLGHLPSQLTCVLQITHIYDCKQKNFLYCIKSWQRVSDFWWPWTPWCIDHASIIGHSLLIGEHDLGARYDIISSNACIWTLSVTLVHCNYPLHLHTGLLLRIEIWQSN